MLRRTQQGQFYEVDLLRTAYGGEGDQQQQQQQQQQAPQAQQPMQMQMHQMQQQMPAQQAYVQTSGFSSNAYVQPQQHMYMGTQQVVKQVLSLPHTNQVRNKSTAHHKT